MYNEIDHDLEQLELPNIIYAHTKGKRVAETVTIHPFLRPLLIKLAKVRPNWKLFGTQVTLREDNLGWAGKFTVYEGNTKLGTIAKDRNYSSGHDVFSIDNDRLEARRMRGHSTTTKDMAKAFKIITKEFRGKSVIELITEAANSSRGATNTAIREKQHRYSSIVASMRDAFVSFAEANWAAFETFSEETKATGQANVENYFDAKESHKEALKLERGGGTVVVLHGNEYILSSNDTVRVLPNDELPPYVKRAVGMLKLVDKGTFIPGFGVKVNPTTIFVMAEEGEE